MFLPAEMPVLGRIAIHQPIGDKVDEAEHGGYGKAPAPAKSHDEEGDNRNADDIGELGGRVENGGRAAALPGGKPQPRRFLIADHAGGFRDAQQQAGREYAGIAAAQGGCRRCRGPEKGAPAPHGLDAETVQQQTARQLGQGVGPEESAEEKTDRLRRQAEIMLKLRRGDREADAINVIDQNTGGEKDTDGPAAMRHAFLGQVCPQRRPQGSATPALANNCDHLPSGKAKT